MDAASGSSTGRLASTRDLVVGIVRVQRYPSSCVIWGYIYNASQRHFDMEPRFRLRKVNGDLCQKATTQFQGQEATLHSNTMLYFWPAFTWNIAGEGVPEGYTNIPSQADLATLEVIVADRSYVVPVSDDSTNLGPLRSLDDAFIREIRKQLGTFPENFLGSQPFGR